MISTLHKRFLSFSLLAFLTGCGNNFAPVTESNGQAFSSYQKTHTVKRGETLYAIAFHYDTDYRTLARLNRINPPYTLRVGQVLHVQGATRPPRPAQNIVRYKPYTPPKVKQPSIIYSPQNRYARSASGWLWPVSGRVVTSFIPEQGKKGINIACKKGDKVIAAANGIVAYAGSGLAGYGNLIIVRHSNEYLTAYGNNARNLVSEGQHVKAGQVIAESGIVDRKYTGVHFEIRKAGVPVNPLNYLQKG